MPQRSNMEKYNFISFDETPSVENQLGIATIVYDDEILLRFKITPNPKGGFYIGRSAVKGEPQGDKMVWLDSHTSERQSTKLQLEKVIRENVDRALNPNSEMPEDDDIFGASKGQSKESYKDEGVPF